MKSRIAVGRIVGTVIAVIAIGLAVHCARDCIARNAEFHAWLEARPMEVIVDFSKSGAVTVPFRQTCSISHGEALYLKTTPRLDGKPDELLRGLSAKVIIKDSGGKEIESARIDGTRIYQGASNDEIALAGFVPFRVGDYLATIHVDSGVPALAGTEQLVYAKYQLCGLEQFPAWIAAAFSFGSAIIGFLAAGCVLPGVLRYGFRRGTDLPPVRVGATTG